MKRSLVFLNTTDAETVHLYKHAIGLYPEFSPFFISTNPAVPKWLQSVGLDCSLVTLSRERINAENIKSACSILEKHAFTTTKIPETSLPVWKVIFWDRFYQFMHVSQSDTQKALLDFLDYHLLIAPMDIHDLESQRLRHAAEARGIPTVGIRCGDLRTKEYLDASLRFDKYVVSTNTDSRFLTTRKDICASKISTVTNTSLSENYNHFSHQIHSKRAEILANAGLDPTKKIVLVSFALRHIWELRQFLKILPESIKASNQSVTAFQIAFYPEGQSEFSEFRLLFKSELRDVNHCLIRPDFKIIELLPLSQHFVYFRIAEIASTAAKLQIKVTIFDPFLFNRSNLLLCDEPGIEIHTDKNLPVLF